ncbi:MAG: DUF58 domain-containing protein [Planctomycetota bacterium]|nr:DUF58 domain-containing protein [Planctomycetota bacterium]
MPRPSDATLALAERFVPVLGFRPNGRSGDRLGPGVGASLEFEDRRSYAPGDDVRHVDWRALARTGDLMVRVHREEVQPRLDVLLDASASMASEPEKEIASANLAGFFLRAGSCAGFEVRFVRLGARPMVLSALEYEREGVTFDEIIPLGDAIAASRHLLTPGGLWLCISDFLTERGANLKSLASRRGSASLLQVLGPWESDPPVGSSLRLEDAEGGGKRDLLLDAGVVAAYRKRLERLSDGLSDEARRLGMRYLRLNAGTPLQESARSELIASGFVNPA